MSWVHLICRPEPESVAMTWQWSAGYIHGITANLSLKLKLVQALLKCYCKIITSPVFVQVKRKFFYLDAEHFEDKQLLQRLSPPDPSAELSEGNDNIRWSRTSSCTNCFPCICLLTYTYYVMHAVDNVIKLKTSYTTATANFTLHGAVTTPDRACRLDSSVAAI